MANQFAQAYSCVANFQQAAESVRRQILGEFPAGADLVFFFVSGFSSDTVREHLDEFGESMGARHSIGAIAYWAFSNGLSVSKDIESTKSIAVLACNLPDTRISVGEFSWSNGDLVDFSFDTQNPGENILDSDGAVVVLGESNSLPNDSLLIELDRAFPGVPVVGGLLGDESEDGLAVWLNGREIVSGGAIIGIQGGVRIRNLVSQAARPIGSPLVITHAEGNQIIELGGKSAAKQLEKICQTLPTRELKMVESNLGIGKVFVEARDRWRYGDFLMRPIQFVDDESGAIFLEGGFRKGQTVQFQLYDWEAAKVDWIEQLRIARTTGSPSASLLFSSGCRQDGFFPDASQDMLAFANNFEGVPMAGLVTAGEYGQHQGASFLHWFSVSTILFG